MRRELNIVQPGLPTRRTTVRISSGAVTMRVSKPPLLRMSALLPLTGATAFHVPAWLANTTRSFCWTSFHERPSPREAWMARSHHTSPSDELRATLVKIVLAIGRCRPRCEWCARTPGIRCEARRRQPEINWYVGLKANEPEIRLYDTPSRSIPAIQGLSPRELGHRSSYSVFVSEVFCGCMGRRRPAPEN
jgi:hypothetical protein